MRSALSWSNLHFLLFLVVHRMHLYPFERELHKTRFLGKWADYGRALWFEGINFTFAVRKRTKMQRDVFSEGNKALCYHLMSDDFVVSSVQDELVFLKFQYFRVVATALGYTFEQAHDCGYRSTSCSTLFAIPADPTRCHLIYGSSVH